MCSLNKHQVELIASDVEKAKITYLHLADDLTDHLCCEVETLMDSGKTFDEAYEIVKELAGFKVLQKIQESTRYLIDKNYRIMKKTMKISGLISLSLLGIATVFKIMHWPGAGIGLVLGFFVLCFLFFPAAIYLNYREMKQKGQILLHVAILIGGIALMAGVLFKVQHWPGANIILMAGWFVLIWIFLPILLFVQLKKAPDRKAKTTYTIGVIALILFELATAFKMFHWPGAAVLMLVGSVLLFCVFLPRFTYRQFRETGKITGQYIFIVITSMFFILFTFLIAINVSKTVLDSFTSQDYNTRHIISYLDKKNEQIIVDFKNLPDSINSKYTQNIIKIQDDANNICNYIESLKIELIQAVEKVDNPTAKALSLSPENITSKDNYDIITRIMMGENYNGKAFELKSKIEAFKSDIDLIPDNPHNLKELSSSLLDTSDKVYFGENQKWEWLYFYHNVLIDVLSELSNIEANVRLVEKDALKSIIARNN